jgi:hypothetical protein
MFLFGELETTPLITFLTLTQVEGRQNPRVYQTTVVLSEGCPCKCLNLFDILSTWIKMATFA